MNAPLTPEQNAPLLSVRNLTVALPGRRTDRAHAVSNLSVDLFEREILCIVGESGSGKSMTANAIMGLLPQGLHATPESRIVLAGRDLLQSDEPTLRALRGRDMAMIFQEPLSALNPVMTVGEQIREVIDAHGALDSEAARAARVLDMLDFVGLPDPENLQRSYPHRLSGGQRQRIMIAMALVLEPKLLIADEPTTALDVTTQAQILTLIKRIQREKGMGVMFVTHDFGVVAEIADRVAVMEHGLLVEHGPAAHVLNTPRHPYTRRLIAAVPRQRHHESAVLAEDEPLLRVQHLHKRYVSGGWFNRDRRVVPAVENVSFSVRRGETLGIVGESGSGKSTIGKCLLRLTSVDDGQIVFDGCDLAHLSAQEMRPVRRDVQMIFQDPFASLNPRHTVGRTLCDGPRAMGVSALEAERRARELLHLVGLDANAWGRYPNQFSGGQRQRIGIARALALQPKLIVADEPVSALDVSVQAQVLQLLTELQQRLALTLIFITHDLRVAAQICHRIAVMHRGRIVELGPPSQIFDAPQHDYTQRLIAAVPGQHWDGQRLVS